MGKETISITCLGFSRSTYFDPSHVTSYLQHENKVNILIK